MPLNSDSKFKKFAQGFTVPLRAMDLIISHPKLIVLSLIPIFLTLFVIALIIYAGLIGAWGLTHDLFTQYIGSYTTVLSSLATVFVALILGYFFFHTFSLLTTLIASPFNDYLAENTEKAKNVTPPDNSFLALVRVFFLDLRKTSFSLLVTAVLAILTLIPPLGIVSYFGFALINTLTLSPTHKAGVAEA